MSVKNKRSKRQKKETRIAWMFLLPSLLGVSIFVLIPFGDVIRRSFYEAMSEKFLGINNYKQVFTNEAFQLAAKNTGRFILTCIPLLLLVSLLISLLVNGRKKGGNFFKTSFLIPMAVPVASVVVIWKVLFENQGLVNKIITSYGGEPTDWMHSSSAFYIMVLSYLWKNTGYDMVLWLAGLNSISTALYEAAAIDGAGVFKKFRYITLPELLPTVFILTVLSLINSFKVFREAYLIAGNYPDNSIYMLQHLFNNWFLSMDIQKMCAAATLFAAVVLIFILLLLWGVRRKEYEWTGEKT